MISFLKRDAYHLNPSVHPPKTNVWVNMYIFIYIYIYIIYIHIYLSVDLLLNS
jgi:hypothetical protein